MEISASVIEGKFTKHNSPMNVIEVYTDMGEVCRQCSGHLQHFLVIIWLRKFPLKSAFVISIIVRLVEVLVINREIGIFSWFPIRNDIQELRLTIEAEEFVVN